MRIKKTKPTNTIKTVQNTAHYLCRQLNLHVQVQPYRTDDKSFAHEVFYLKKETFYSEIASWKYKYLPESTKTDFFTSKTDQKNKADISLT